MHRDGDPPDKWPFTDTRKIKMFMAIWDVASDGGPLMVVPGVNSLVD